ncbi:MAG: winged helix-turn-helix transcriptional regulator [Desulfobacterales bacterium]|nr:winged helix-turn-helix transcriptional regulator [Desulfobacterales bacterium]
MDPQDIRSLQFLEEIGDSHSPTQRDLAKKFNMSLGLVNSFMKRLARKGYLKITTIPRNRVRYILTPKGFAEKSRLTYHFIQYSLHFYKESLRSLEDLLNELENSGVRKVVFYGANDLAEIAFISLKASNIRLIGVIDNLKEGETFLGYTVKSIAELRDLEFDRIIITTIDSQKAILNKLLQKKIPGEKIIMLE